jgi:hypothetical protein
LPKKLAMLIEPPCSSAARLALECAATVVDLSD